MPAILANQIGVPVQWGLAAETGFLIKSVTHKYNTDKEEFPGRYGSTETVVYFNESVSISMDGELPASGIFSGTLASSLTLGNPLSSYLKSSVSTGQTTVESFEIGMDRKGAKTFKLEAIYRPL